jgi:hypothetical protein
VFGKNWVTMIRDCVYRWGITEPSKCQQHCFGLTYFELA